MKAVLVLVLGLWLGMSPPAGAQTYDQALAKFNNGEFEETVAAARALGTGAGYTLAVRAQLVLIQYIYEPAARTAAIERAIADGRKAVAMAPGNVEAKINLGIAIGLKAKQDRSISQGKEARDLFREAVEMDPDNAWTLGTLGAWHGETIYQGGLIPARLIMGARRKRTYELFEKALQADPGNLTIRAAYVRTLLKLKPEKFAEAIEQNIRYILEASPDNALEELMQEQIRQIQSTLASDDEERLEQLLEEAVVIAGFDTGHGKR